MKKLATVLAALALIPVTTRAADGIGDIVNREIREYMRANDLELDDEAVLLTEADLRKVRREFNQLVNPIDIEDILRVRESGALNVFDSGADTWKRPGPVLEELLNGRYRGIQIAGDIRAIRAEVLANFLEDDGADFDFQMDEDDLVTYWQLMDLMNFGIGRQIDPDDIEALKGFQDQFAGNETNIAALHALEESVLGFRSAEVKDEWQTWLAELDATIGN